MKRPYIIAEMGVNFYDTAREMNVSPLEAAMLYIDKAAEAGIDCAKFQSYKAETITSKNSPAYWDTTKEPTPSQYELFKKFDAFGEDEYRRLCEHTKEKGMDFTSTPFDYASADYLYDMVDFYKISSSDITNHPFLSYIGRKGKPIMLSTGASYLSEVDEAVRVLRESGCEDITLLHCMLSYPTSEENANLSVIKTLKRVYPDYKIGYSDHVSPDDAMTVMTTAYLMGAEVIEKHYTLDKTLTGNDHYHAGDPDDFAKGIAQIDRIMALMGSEERTVFPCEKSSRREARRSLVVTRDIGVGEEIKREDLTAKRPGHGISPRDIDVVIGRIAKTEIPEDTVLSWDMI